MKVIVFVFCLLVSLTNSAQVEAIKGVQYKYVDTYNKYYFSKGGKVLSVKISNREVVLSKHSIESLELEKVIVTKDLPQGYNLENVIESNGRYFLFYSLWNRSDDIVRLCYREIDFENVLLMSEEKVLLEADRKIKKDYHLKAQYGSNITKRFNFEFSKNKEVVAIFYHLDPERINDKKSYDVIGVHVYNKNFESVWNYVYTMPYPEVKIKKYQYAVDSQGVGYVTAFVYHKDEISSRELEEDNLLYHIEVLKLKGKGSMENVVVDQGAIFVRSVDLYEVAGAVMVGVGMFDNKQYRRAADGFFTFSLSPDGSVSHVKHHEIPLDIINMNEDPKSQKKNLRKEDKGAAVMENLELREIIVNEDGSLLLISEEYYRVAHSTGGNSYYYTHHYDDILVTKISKEGKLEWMKRLPKKQMRGGYGKGSMSYKYIYWEGNHYLFYMNNSFNESDGDLLVFVISNREGNVNKYVMDKTKDGEEPLKTYNVSSLIVLGQKKILMEGERGKKKKKENLWIKMNIPN